MKLIVAIKLGGGEVEDGLSLKWFGRIKLRIKLGMQVGTTSHH